MNLNYGHIILTGAALGLLIFVGVPGLAWLIGCTILVFIASIITFFNRKDRNQ